MNEYMILANILLFGVVVGALWQLEVVDIAIGQHWANWHHSYAFPFQLLVLHGDNMWLAHDFWIAIIMVCFIIQAIIFIKLKEKII